MFRNSVILFLSAFLLVSCGKTAVPEAGKGTEPVAKTEKIILAMGDSITAGYELPPDSGYPAQLEKLLKSGGYSYRVTNTGISGDTSAGLLARTDWLLQSPEKPDIAILCIGGNDGLQSLPVPELEKNLRAIVAKLKSKDIKVVLAGMRMPINLGPDYVRDFDAVFKRVAIDENLPLYPFFLEGVAKDRNLNLPDGIHPNAAWYAIIAENLFDFLAKEELLVK